MERKTIAILVALILSAIFLFFVLGPGIFNMIPYRIHESIWKGGSGETIFIRSFDIVSALVVFSITYKSIYKIPKANNKH